MNRKMLICKRYIFQTINMTKKDAQRCVARLHNNSFQKELQKRLTVNTEKGLAVMACLPGFTTSLCFAFGLT